MTLQEMQKYAAETLLCFIQTMPDVPFTEDDIIIEFSPQDKIVEKYMELRAKYTPERIINESQKQNLANDVFANALIGREKSAVVVLIDPKITKTDIQRNMFHEFMHIFCAKTEMDGEHFIDIYGTGTTTLDTDYDAYLSAGYKLWSEFIANYYALKYAEKRIFAFREARQGFVTTLYEVTNDNIVVSKDLFAYACSYLFNCTDIDRVIAKLNEPNYIWSESIPRGAATREAFLDCAEIIQKQLRAERPWKISEEFISNLGLKFLLFRTTNSIYHGIVN